MEENLDKLFDYRALIPGSGRFASIVGIGGGAGRVVDQMRKCCLPDVQLYAFGMNRKEMDELSLCGKYLIGHKGIQSFFRQVLYTFHLHFRIKELHACFKEIHSQFIFRFIQEHINLVLMNYFLQIRNHKLRDVLILLRSFRPKYLIDID